MKYKKDEKDKYGEKRRINTKRTKKYEKVHTGRKGLKGRKGREMTNKYEKDVQARKST